MKKPMRSHLGRNWALSDEICFLNHGSFGSTPILVLEEQDRIREMIERDPVKFFERDYLPMMKYSIMRLSEFMSANPEGMALVKNTTEGVNTVLRSLILNPGDEVIVTNHSYQACWNAVDYVTKKSGAKTTVVALPFPITSPEEIIESILS